MKLALAPGRCVVARMPYADCAACVTACPHDALDVSAEGVALAPELCTGCGHCATACPQAALSLPDAPSPVLAEEGRAAVLACARAPNAPAGAARCAQAVGLGDLAQLWLGGVRRLVLATGRCETCPDAPRGEGGLATSLARLNLLLASRGLEQMEARAAPAGYLLRPPPNARRRALFGLWGKTRVQPDALKALQNLPAAPDTEALFAYVPAIDPDYCTGCDACVRICSENALIGIKDECGKMGYEASPAACTGCGLCRDVCDESALTVLVMSEAPPPVPLAPYTCRSCRAALWHPSAEFAAGALCPSCRISGHHRQSVVVLS